jgi:hypothetical protein
MSMARARPCPPSGRVLSEQLDDRELGVRLENARSARYSLRSARNAVCSCMTRVNAAFALLICFSTSGRYCSGTSSSLISAPFARAASYRRRRLEVVVSSLRPRRHPSAVARRSSSESPAAGLAASSGCSGSSSSVGIRRRIRPRPRRDRSRCPSRCAPRCPRRRCRSLPVLVLPAAHLLASSSATCRPRRRRRGGRPRRVLRSIAAMNARGVGS